MSKKKKSAREKPEQELEEKSIILSRRIELLVLLAGMVVAFFIRLIYWHRTMPIAIGDMAYYIDNARALAAGDLWGAIHFHYPPFYSFIIFILHGLGAGYETSARLVSAIAGSLMVVPVYILGKYFFNSRAALFSAALWLLAWPGISVSGYAESLFCLMVYATLYLAMIGDENKKWPVFLSAVLLGMANLAKSEALLYIILFAIIVFLRDFRPRLKMIPALAGYIIIFLVMVFPYSWAYHHESGKISLNPKSSTLFLIYNTSYVKFLYQLRRDESGYFTYAERVYQEGDKKPIEISIFDLVRKNFSGFLKNYFKRIPRALVMVNTVSKHIFPGALLVFILAFLRFRKDYILLKREWPLYFILLMGVASICLFDPWERFFSSLFPILVLVVGKGFDQLVSWFESALSRFSRFGPFQRRNYSLAFSGLAVLILCAYGIALLVKAGPDENIAADFATKKDMAEWLRPRLDDGDNILASSVANRVSFFLDISPKRQYLIPIASLKDTIAYAREKNAKYIILQPRDLARAKQFILIFKRGARYPGLRLEVFSQKTGQTTYAIYRVVPEHG
jgi:4-amino-4-deoxy-L-arabinose transferase-like glycosyltransferase